MAEKEPESPTLEVSVLVVTHNVVAQLRRCLAALEQSPDRAKFEIIVVDNGSRDGCQAIDSEFPNVTVLRLPHHCGQTKARNIGIRTAKGEYLLLLSPAVEVQPNTVLALARRLEQEPAALAVTPLLEDPAGQPASLARRLPTPAQVADCWRDPRGLPVVPVASPIELPDGKALLIRKRSLQGINYLDEKYGEYWGDVELAFQIKRAGKQIVLAEDIRARLDESDAPILSSDAGLRACFAADAANGAAVYLAKRFGFARGMLFRVRMVLITLFHLLSFQDPGYAVALLSRLVGGYKIDGKNQPFVN